MGAYREALRGEGVEAEGYGKEEAGYRAEEFFATGVTLVGMSYLYQFLNKKGFFEPLLGDQADDEGEFSAAPDEQEFSG